MKSLYQKVSDSIFTYVLEEKSAMVKMLCLFHDILNSLDECWNSQSFNCIGDEFFNEFTSIFQDKGVNLSNEGINEFLHVDDDSVEYGDAVVLIGLHLAHRHDDVHRLRNVGYQCFFIILTEVTGKFTVCLEV